ncbi:hypothetical protein [Robbsia andropogonis]|nr:hypothetical protein [Robbsia andropogonis]MCP1119513.1 hypothetical protein [Robbsia andropogonis]MCP1129496.1 hypothetical protein [Robbsia andropogonis]
MLVLFTERYLSEPDDEDSVTADFAEYLEKRRDAMSASDFTFLIRIGAQLVSRSLEESWNVIRAVESTTITRTVSTKIRAWSALHDDAFRRNPLDRRDTTPANAPLFNLPLVTTGMQTNIRPFSKLKTHGNAGNRVIHQECADLDMIALRVPFCERRQTRKEEWRAKAASFEAILALTRSTQARARKTVTRSRQGLNGEQTVI